jgi:hypothetical protein
MTLRLAFLCGGLLWAADPLADGQRWWKHVQFLADDRLEGRNTGSAGHKLAAQYVAQEFERAGLKPAGTRQYLQPVPFRVQQIDERQCKVELVRNGQAEPVKFGEEAILRTSGDFARELEAEAVFIGYGLVIPEAKHDDTAGVDLRGKIAVFLSGGPKQIPGNLRSHYSSGAERWMALRRAGAVGLITLQNPKSMDIPWARQASSRFGPTMSVTGLGEGGGPKVSLTLNPDRAERFFAASGQRFAGILAAAAADQPLPHLPLNIGFRVRAAATESSVESENVVGLLQGSDPKLKNEYVVLSAHLDHLGLAQTVDGDRVFNGAMDNASGIAWLIETALRVKQSGARPKRSLIFVAVTGEEKGLQGSRYFAERPPMPNAKIVANINMDMVLPLFPLKYLEVQGLGESTLGDDIRAVCQARGITVQFDKEPDRNRFIRSDQYSFVRRGIPALAFKFGWVPGSPEEKIYQDWYRDRYHGLSDDLSQPVDLAGAGLFTQVLGDLLTRVANAPQAPSWKPDSFFRRFAQ